MDMSRKNNIAQWAFNTSPILGRFHLWLEDVEERWPAGEPPEGFSFVGDALEDAFIMTVAVTALGTRLFGRFGEGKGLDKAGINAVKKDADAVSAYAMSEALWYLTRRLPENHAVMVSLGEGLMPKAGETPEMGSNPLLGFGRVYARPRWPSSSTTVFTAWSTIASIAGPISGVSFATLGLRSGVPQSTRSKTHRVLPRAQPPGRLSFFMSLTSLCASRCPTKDIWAI